MSRIPLLLALCYPVVAHVAVALADARLVLVSAGLLIALILLPLARRSRPGLVVLALLLGMGLIALLGRLDAAMLVLYVPPVAFNAFVGWIFARSLVSGSVPLIERFSRAMREPGAVFDAAVIGYARRLTLAWALLLFALAALNLGLALLAEPAGLLRMAGIVPPVSVSQAVWSWFANVLNYVIIGAVFVIEWFVRRWRFPNHQHAASLAQFATRLAALGPQLWRGSAR